MNKSQKEPKYRVGTKIERRDDPLSQAYVEDIINYANGQYQYQIAYTSGRQGIEIVAEEEIRPVTQSTKPFDNLANGRFNNYRDFTLSSTYHKIENEVNNTISTLKASKTLFKPHQFKPLIKFLNSMHRRILIADEVGLGKTIEAGHILLEMYARGMLSRVLVVCPNSLQHKWRYELEDKFGFRFKILDSSDFADFIRNDQKGGEQTFYGIINYAKFSSSTIIQKELENHIPLFDLLICDEAQALRNHTTNRYKTFKPLVESAKSAAFLTATPINNSLDDLYNLVALLDPQRYHSRLIFENDIQMNKPFIKALSALNSGKEFKDIATTLEETEVFQHFRFGETHTQISPSLFERFEEDPLFQRVMDRLKNGETSLENKVLIQRDLSDLNTLNHLYTRTLKRDVEEDRTLREPHKYRISLTKEEKQLFEQEKQAIKERYQNYDRPQLAVITKLRQLASSMPAYIAKEQKKKNASSVLNDSKFEMLKKIFEEVVIKNNNKIIVFAFFKDTLEYLKKRTDELGIECRMIHGGNSEVRNEILTDFENRDDIKVLFSSQVGGEGLDLQFCNAIVNYDLPWNPMKVEQRIGRIDRIGQESPIIHIYNLVVANSIEETIYDRLLDKIEIFKESLGDLEAILAEEGDLFEELMNLEYELYTTELNQHQIEERIDQTAEAVLNRKYDLEKIERELTDVLVNDIHFQNEIDRIVKNRRYVTEKDLYNYLQSLIRIELPFLNLQQGEESGVYKLWLHEQHKNHLFNFIEQQLKRSSNKQKEVLNRLYSEFKKELLNENELLLTFNQELAFKRKELVLINSYHPLVFAATKYFEQQVIQFNNAFRFSISVEKFQNHNIPPGHYMLLVGHIAIERTFLDEKKDFHYLFPIVANLNNEEPELLPEDLSEYYMSVCQEEAKEYRGEVNIPPKAIEDLRPQIVKRLAQRKKQLKEDEEIRQNSLKQRIKKQLDDFYDYQITMRKQQLSEKKGIENIIRKQIDDLEKEYEEKQMRLDHSEVKASMKEQLVAHVFVH